MGNDDLAELNAKVAFFDQLASNLDDDALDPREVADRELRRRFFHPRASSTNSKKRHVGTRPSSSPVRATGGLSRSSSSHVARSQVSSGGERAAVIKATPAGAHLRRGRVTSLLNSDGRTHDENIIPDSNRPASKVLQRSNSTPLPQLKRINSKSARLDDPPSAAIMAGAQKRQKRKHNSGDNLKLKPDEQQVFRGLAFFYVPDNDIAPVRRMRIGKAREYGAEWTRSVADASHIIVEKALDYKAVQGFLFQASATKPPIVVNEDYPIDCIQFGSTLDPDQAKYRVTGQPSPISAESTRAGTEKSNPPMLEDLEGSSKSLPVKAPPTNPGRWDYVPPPGTPSRSAESSLAAQEAPSASMGSQVIAVEAGDLVASPPPVAHEPEQTGEESSRRTDGGAKEQGTAQPADELSEMISVMVEFKDLPVDSDDDLDNHGGSKSRHSDDDISSPGSGDERPRSKFVKYHRRRNGNTPTGKRLGFEERFACNQAGAKDAKVGNPNARTIEVLQKMADYYNRTNDHWRTTSYRKAISTLKRQTERITTEDEAFKLPSVGRRLAQKIEEIVTTDRLQRLEYAQQDPMVESLQLFLGIYGVGTSLAQQWIAQGYRTLDELSAKAKLTPNQRLGIEHYDDLNTRIPRKEMVELGRVVTQGAGRVDPEIEMIIGGSFRRGAESSGDIDFIITKRDTMSTTELMPFLQGLVRRLEESGFLVARLASSRSEGDGSKWHGCCALPFTPGFHSGEDAVHSSDAEARQNYRPIWRRIDFLLVPESERGAALLYFTGNDIFNRSMRLLASRKSMRLNQRGLYKDVMRGPGRQKLSEGELVEGRDERRIFEVLGVRWREPHERWC